MRWLNWLKRNELRRIEYLEKELEQKNQEAFELWTQNNQHGNRLSNLLAHFDVSMQGGRDWATVLNEVIEQLTPEEKVGARQATLELMHRSRIEGKSLNMLQTPVFEFPSGGEVMGLKNTPTDNTWWQEHSGR